MKTYKQFLIENMTDRDNCGPVAISHITGKPYSTVITAIGKGFASTGGGMNGGDILDTLERMGMQIKRVRLDLIGKPLGKAEMILAKEGNPKILLDVIAPYSGENHAIAYVNGEFHNMQSAHMNTKITFAAEY